MAGLPHDRHGLIPMLVAIRVAAQRKQRAAEAENEKTRLGRLGPGRTDHQGLA